ncbi:phospholipid scramblase 2-like isoform X2 [Clavelina lepadiformis]
MANPLPLKPIEQPQTGWMPIPTVANCPPGLEYLTQLDQVLVHQEVSLIEVLLEWEAKNKYRLKNSVGQQCYFAAEESEVCMRQMCGSSRGFTMHITDNSGAEVIRVTRPFKCWAGCCWCANADCCSYNIEIEAPVGQVIGRVRQSQSFWYNYFDVQDATGKNIFTIKGPCCVCPGPCCTCDFPFDIWTKETTPSVIGRVTKQWSGLTKELFTDATNFSVTFPIDLDVKMKAVLLGATFLIDMMFFEVDES